MRLCQSGAARDIGFPYRVGGIFQVPFIRHPRIVSTWFDFLGRSPMRTIRSALCCTLAATAALVASSPLSAQQYPTKPVKIIVAFAPGGGNDFIARRVQLIDATPSNLAR